MKNKSARISILAAALALSLGFGASVFAAGDGFGGAPASGGPLGGERMEAPSDDDTNSERPEFPERPDMNDSNSDSSSRPTPPAKPDGQTKRESSDTNRPELPARPEGRPDGKGGMHGLIEKINALEDGDTKDDLLEKVQAAEDAMQELMEAAEEAGLIEAPPEKPTDNDKNNL